MCFLTIISSNRKGTSVVVQWSRHGRNVITPECTHLEPSATKTRAIWETPLQMVVTLYKVRLGL